MSKIKPLTKKRPFRRFIRRLFGIKPKLRASDFLANIDEMHESRPSCLHTICPCCGKEIPLFGTARRDSRPDGRTIAQTIIDEVPYTDYQKRAVEILKELAPGYPEYTYNITAVDLEAIRKAPPYEEYIQELSERLNSRVTPFSAIEVVDGEEHRKIHQIRK